VRRFGEEGGGCGVGVGRVGGGGGGGWGGRGWMGRVGGGGGVVGPGVRGCAVFGREGSFWYSYADVQGRYILVITRLVRGW